MKKMIAIFMILCMSFFLANEELISSTASKGKKKKEFPPHGVDCVGIGWVCQIIVHGTQFVIKYGWATSFDGEKTGFSDTDGIIDNAVWVNTDPVNNQTGIGYYNVDASWDENLKSLKLKSMRELRYTMIITHG